MKLKTWYGDILPICHGGLTNNWENVIVISSVEWYNRNNTGNIASMIVLIKRKLWLFNTFCKSQNFYIFINICSKFFYDNIWSDLNSEGYFRSFRLLQFLLYAFTNEKTDKILFLLYT